MKNSKEFGSNLQKLVNSLKKQYKAEKAPQYSDPVEAAVFGVLCEYTTDKNAHKIYDKISEHFVDLNDLRVCRKEEAVEIFSPELKGDAAANAAADISRLLNTIFTKYDCLEFESLDELGKRDTKKELETLDCMSRFVLNYTMMFAIDAHSIPLNRVMIEYLITSECIHPESDIDEITGFIERQVTAKDGYSFYYNLRQASYTAGEKSAAKNSGSDESKSSADKKTKTKKTTSKSTKKKSAKKSSAKNNTAKKKTNKKK